MTTFWGETSLYGLRGGHDCFLFAAGWDRKSLDSGRRRGFQGIPFCGVELDHLKAGMVRVGSRWTVTDSYYVSLCIVLFKTDMSCWFKDVRRMFPASIFNLISLGHFQSIEEKIRVGSSRMSTKKWLTCSLWSMRVAAPYESTRLCVDLNGWMKAISLCGNGMTFTLTSPKERGEGRGISKLIRSKFSDWSLKLNCPCGLRLSLRSWVFRDFEHQPKTL